MLKGKRWVSVLSLALLLFGLWPLQPQVAAAAERGPFVDTYATRYETAVSQLYQLKVVSGLSDRYFGWDQPVTRAQMAALVLRAMGADTSAAEGGPTFTDVSRSYWAYNVVEQASKAGIIGGYGNGRFGPEDQVTYAQAVAMLLRATGQNLFVKGEYPVGHVLKAQELGLLENVSFEMNKPVNRGEAALLIWNSIFKIVNPYTGQTLSQKVFKVAGEVVVTPAENYIGQGVTKLTATAKDWAGKELPVGSVKWNLITGRATLDADGTLTVQGSDPVTVEATSGELSLRKTFTILREIAVTPATGSIPMNGAVRLEAQGVTGSGSTVPLTATWRVQSGSATVAQDGTVTATGGGAVVVAASYGSLTAQARLEVVSGLQVTPATVAIAAGDTVTFAANATLPGGQTKPVAVTWSATGGTIDAQGRFTAGQGNATVEAKAGTVKATAQVTVVKRVTITPDVAMLKRGEVVNFTTTAYDANGNVVSATPTLSVTPGLGVLGANGSFIATAPGSGTVTARFGSVQATANIAVAGDPAAISVTTSKSTLYANGSDTATITARVVDAAGNTVKGRYHFSFVFGGSSSAGSLSAAGVDSVDGIATITYKAGTTTGTVNIFASVSELSIPAGATAVATSAPAIARVVLAAYPPNLVPNGTSTTTITATLVDVTGTPIANNTSSTINVTLSQDNMAAGLLNSTGIAIVPGGSSGTTTFRAGTANGTTRISGYSNYTVTPISIQTLAVGPMAQLKVKVQEDNILANGVTNMTVRVELQDANGYVLADNSSTMVSLTAVQGSTSLSLSPAWAANGVATFSLHTTQAGQFTLQAFAAGLRSSETNVNFKPGAPAKLAVAVEPLNEIAADNVTELSLVAKVTDVNGNVVTDRSYQVTFRKTTDGDATTFPDGETAQTVNGVATVRLRATSAVGVDAFSATATGLLTVGSPQVTSRIVGVPVKVRVQPITNVQAGMPATVKVYLLDSQNHVVTGDSGRLVSLLFNRTGVTYDGPKATQNGVATFAVTSEVSGQLLVTAMATGVEADSTGQIVTMTALPADHIVLEADPPGLAADGVSKARIRAYAVDRFGNRVSRDITAALNLSTSMYGTLNMLTLNNYTTAEFTSSSNAGSVTITGTGTYPVTPLTLTTYSPGTPARVVVEAPASVVAGTSAASQATIRVRVVDTNGNVMTSLSSGTGSQVTPAGLLLTGASGQTTTITNTASGLSSYGVTPNGTTVGGASLISGTATFTYTNTKAEAITLDPVVYYQARKLPVTTAVITTVAGPVTQLLFQPEHPVLNIDAGLSTLRVVVADANGNPVTTVTDTVTLSLAGTAYLTLGSAHTVDVVNGYGTFTVTPVAGSNGGSTEVSAWTARTALRATARVETDRAPGRAQVLLSQSSALTSDGSVRVTITTPSHYLTQKFDLYVNGMPAMLYDGPGLSNPITEIPSGSGSITGYLNLRALGTGVKELRVLVRNDLGVGPLSEAVQLTIR